MADVKRTENSGGGGAGSVTVIDGVDKSRYSENVWVRARGESNDTARNCMVVHLKGE
jgi:hypothetical protein